MKGAAKNLGIILQDDVVPFETAGIELFNRVSRQLLDLIVEEFDPAIGVPPEGNGGNGADEQPVLFLALAERFLSLLSLQDAPKIRHQQVELADVGIRVYADLVSHSHDDDDAVAVENRNIQMPANCNMPFGVTPVPRIGSAAVIGNDGPTLAHRLTPEPGGVHWIRVGAVRDTTFSHGAF